MSQSIGMPITDECVEAARASQARAVCTRFEARIIKTLNRYPQDAARRASLIQSKDEFNKDRTAGKQCDFSKLCQPVLWEEFERILATKSK